MFNISTVTFMECFNFISETFAAEYGSHVISPMSRHARLSENRISSEEVEDIVEELITDKDITIGSFHYGKIQDANTNINLDMFFSSNWYDTIENRKSCIRRLLKYKLFKDTDSSLSVLLPYLPSETIEEMTYQYEVVHNVFKSLIDLTIEDYYKGVMYSIDYGISKRFTLDLSNILTLSTGLFPLSITSKKIDNKYVSETVKNLEDKGVLCESADGSYMTLNTTMPDIFSFQLCKLMKKIKNKTAEKKKYFQFGKDT